MLGVLICLVVRSTVSGTNIIPKHLCPEDMFQADHELATTPARDRFITLSARRRRKIHVPQLVADHSVISGRRISASTVRRRLYNSRLYARRPIVCVPPLNRQQRRACLAWAR
ncbi:HTH_Tnp_Tc3_2 domain-containing protein [Trichonephila clavipes]|nr:HTH_Tnp_Tc3_2 domain-containing protein [Trichonephila clavipes]